MARTEHEPRRFITRHDVEDAAAAGRAIRLRDRDVLTDEAAQRARDLGVSVGKEEAAGPAAATAPAQAPAHSSSAEDRLRSAVRTAVVAELGHAPAALDSVIDRILRQRRDRSASADPTR